MKLFNLFKNKEKTFKEKHVEENKPNKVTVDVIPKKVLESFESSKGGSDLAKFIRTHSQKDVETFCKNYQFDNIKLDDGLSKDVNRFEGITIFAEILMDYERVRKEDPGAKLPSNFPYNRLKDILIKRIVNFLKEQTNIDIAPIYRTRIHDFAMTLMGIKDYRSAIECLKISKPSLKGDDEFWLAACYFNIANDH